MMKKLIIIVIVLFIVACSANKKPVMTLITNGGNNNYLSLLEKGALASAEDNNIILNFVTFDEEANFEVQKNILKNEIEKMPDIIALSPIEGDYSEEIENIKNKGIEFVVFNSKLDIKDSNNSVVSVYIDNASISYLVAQKMFDVLKYRIEDFSKRKKAKIGILQYNHSTEANTFSAKFIESFNNLSDSDTNFNTKGKYEIEIRIPKVDDISNAQIDANYFKDNGFVGMYCTSQKMVEAAIESYSDIDIDYAAKDNKKVIICGVDFGAIQMDAIKSGIVYGSVIKNPYLMGYFVVEMGVFKFAGDVVLDNTMGVVWYDKNNIDSKEISALLY